MISGSDTSVAIAALTLTLKVAGVATALNLILGIAAGFFLSRTRIPGRNFIEALLTLPMVLPPTVLGYYLLVLLGRRSGLGQWLEENFGIQIIFTWQAAVIATTIVSFPLICRPARAAFDAVDPRLEDAARVCGLGAGAVFFRVTLPLAARGILAGLLLAFARAMGEFGATLMIAGNIPGKTQTLSTAIYEAVQTGQEHTAAWLVIITSGVCVAVLLASTSLAPRYAAQSRRDLRP